MPIDKNILIILSIQFFMIGIAGCLFSEIICDYFFKIKCVRCNKYVRMPKHAMCDCCHKTAHKLVEKRVNCVFCKKFTRDRSAICNTCYIRIYPQEVPHDSY